MQSSGQIETKRAGGEVAKTKVKCRAGLVYKDGRLRGLISIVWLEVKGRRYPGGRTWSVSGRLKSSPVEGEG